MNSKTSIFFEKICAKNSPTFLLLGQSIFRHGAKVDFFLNSILSKYLGKNATSESKYSDIFDGTLHHDSVSARSWISEQANALVAPTWLNILTKFAWSAVYTSAIDGSLNRNFRESWRSIQPIYSPRLHPLDPRNRSKLHITYLYGTFDREDESELCPITKLELTMRQAAATSLIQRLPEQVTPLGIVAIEAYDIETDWLSSERLFPALMALQNGQAYLFSATKTHLEDPYFSAAISSGKLIVFEESLATIILQGIDAGIIPLGENSGLGQSGHKISFENKQFVVPEHLWAQITRYGTILDDSIVEKSKSQSAEKRYSSFRTFLAESGTQPVWEAHAQGLPFERDFERDLFSRLKNELQTSTFESEPIIIHGQTGVGKTIALASIAFRIHLEKTYPVIFIPRRNQRFNFTDIDNFCKWAEDIGFSATLIVWDGMQDIEQYHLLHSQLQGRGRKFVLLGSSYKLDISEEKNKNYILAPSEFGMREIKRGQRSEDELSRFKEFLSSFEPILGRELESIIKKGDATFLVALYRLLPETRSQVKSGLNFETGVAAVAIRSNADAIQPEVHAENILSLALQKAGVLNHIPILTTDKNMIGGEWISAEQELIGLIMVPGRFGIQVPIEILMRSISKVTLINFYKVVVGIDLFRWTEDNLDNISIGPRHALEAKLIAQIRLGGIGIEIQYATKLLLSVHRGQSIHDNTEIQFASEFVQNLGPNGPEKKLYSDYYMSLANTLTQVREVNGVKAPRLMLQEASLLREATVLNLIDKNDFDSRVSALTRAKSVLFDAIEEIGSSPRIARFKSKLLVELASIHGALAMEYMRNNMPLENILSEYEAAYASANRARTLTPEDFFAIDVIAWSTRDVLVNAKLTDQVRLELIVTVFNTFAMCDGVDITSRDKEKLERRRFEFSELLGDDMLQANSLDALEKIGSTAGYYLSAIQIAKELPTGANSLNKDQLINYAAAATYLNSKLDLINQDAKCMYLYFRYWWSANSKLPFFPPERTGIPLDRSQWATALGLLESLLALNTEYSTPTLIYLQAIAKWHLGYYDDARIVWNDLQRISDQVTGKRRITKTYLASNSDGTPIKFHGTVSYVSPDGARGEIFVEGLREKIVFFPKDFGLEDIQRDEQIDLFHIAFNYIAPTADPIRHYSTAVRN
jgi:hypothetical protein